MYEYLDRRYALALYEVAESKGKVDEYLQDLREICDLVENNHDFYEVIRIHRLILEERNKLLSIYLKVKSMRNYYPSF